MVLATGESFTIQTGCEAEGNINNQNYYNQVKVTIEGSSASSQAIKIYEFSFLLNCDRYSRHKKF